MWFFNIIYWLQAFASPVIIFAIIGIATNNKKAFIILLAIGIIAGIIAAEYIRRKIGLSKFFSRLYSTSTIESEQKKKDQDKTL